QVSKGDLEVKTQTVYTTLIRDQNGLGFSIAGGKGCPPYKDNTDSIYISRITEGGAAEKDGKLQVGDRIVSINGVDMEGARHDQAVAMLTGLERFVRLVAEREVLVATTTNPQQHQSPKVVGGTGPRPYTGLYSATSQMATNRPLSSCYKTSQQLPPAAPSSSSSSTASPPRPAPRKQLSSQMSSEPVENLSHTSQSHRSITLKQEKKDEDMSHQGFPKPITSEEFQAMIPPRFLSGSKDDKGCGRGGSNEPTTVTLTIKQPNTNNGLSNGIEFPETPKSLGKVTETITKSTFTETVVTRVTDNKLKESIIIEDVTLVKDGGSLGFSIIGGTDHSCTPFGNSQPGIFISHVVPGGLASTSGKLRIGDRILKVNSEDVTKCKHQEAVMALLKPCNEISLTVQHDPLPEGFQDLTILRKENEKLGMHIKGGLRGHRGNPLDRTDEGVFISKINSGGAAKRDGRLKVGMRLLEVNGISLLGASHQEAVNSLRSSGLKIHLVVCKDREDEDSETIRQEYEMKKELVEWEEQERKEKENNSVVDEIKEKSTPEMKCLKIPFCFQVLDVVRAAEILALGGNEVVAKPKSPGGPNAGDSLKTTTVVMSKHTRAPQTDSNQVS
ncbi:hypothetical protein AAG570_002263, partial [Ranatra chinensis]